MNYTRNNSLLRQGQAVEVEGCRTQIRRRQTQSESRLRSEVAIDWNCEYLVIHTTNSNVAVVYW
jgi:hypothetical protein